jgi:creatinine amidohydrolase/Fe(II)-dependent formamide hydrolase-like protein
MTTDRVATAAAGVPSVGPNGRGQVRLPPSGRAHALPLRRAVLLRLRLACLRLFGRLALLALLALFALVQPALAAAPAATSVLLEDLTSPELQARIGGGATTVLVPIGGTEQNGPHMALGKHNLRVKVLATRIAERLGQAVVAPVIAYVPEGAIDPATQHMRWVGTISIPEAAFEAVLEGAARSLRQHGFRDVVFLADHGGYLKNTERVAARLTREFAAGPPGRPACRVLALTDYYQVTQTDYVEALKARGHGPDEIGRHAGLADTSLMLAIDPAMVRLDRAAARPKGANDGVTGDPRRASAELGRLGTDRIVEVSVAAIGAHLRQRSPAVGGGATMAPAKH